MKTKKPDVLVLNRSYIAIHIIDWKKAMSLIFQGAARPLDRDFITYEYADWLDFSSMTQEYPTVATVNKHIAVPEIIVLKKYDRLPQRDVKYSRQTLFQRDKYRCGYCGGVFEKKQLTVDHIVPRAHGGKSNWTNTISACVPCNSQKADRTPEAAGMPLKFKPKRPRWLSPLADIKPNHPCKSWLRFTDNTLVDIGD
jgi:5-methylcytosine-specific restriction endonuclease McrA